MAVLLCVLAVAACQEDGPQASESQSAFPDLLALQREACEKDGGRWGVALSKASFACYRTMRDAGKICRAASDCLGHCLARSRTCSPVEPFFGCHEVMSEAGVPQTLCIE
jgi:hypothetical protein